MPEKHTYEYAIIRLVPKVEREEFLNIGVILYSKRKRYLEVKYFLNEQRILSFCPNVHIAELEKYLQVWEFICRGDQQGGFIATLDLASRFRWLTAPRSTMIQSSKVHPGRSEDPALVLEPLFTKYVL